jgi:hypothetical protein
VLRSADFRFAPGPYDEFMHRFHNFAEGQRGVPGRRPGRRSSRSRPARPGWSSPTWSRTPSSPASTLSSRPPS